MALLDDVKTFLDITADNQSEDLKLNMIITHAKQHLRLFAPSLQDEDFENDENSAKYLLLNFCRYDYANASEQFDNNYKNELMALRQSYEVSEYEKNSISS
jgi:hypothetical protein